MYSTVIMPNKNINYCQFDMNKLSSIINQGEKILPEIKSNLENTQSEEETIENLYILDRMLDSDRRGMREIVVNNNYKLDEVRMLYPYLYADFARIHKFTNVEECVEIVRLVSQNQVMRSYDGQKR